MRDKVGGEKKGRGKGGPHALNLNLELVGSERGGWGQELSVDGKGKTQLSDTNVSPLRDRWGRGDMVPFSKLSYEVVSASISVLFQAVSPQDLQRVYLCHFLSF